MHELRSMKCMAERGFEQVRMACRPKYEPEDLFERSFRFTCDVYDYCEPRCDLRDSPCRLAHQLFDAAGSVGARTEQSQNPRVAATESSVRKMPSA